MSRQLSIRLAKKAAIKAAQETRTSIVTDQPIFSDQQAGEEFMVRSKKLYKATAVDGSFKIATPSKHVRLSVVGSIDVLAQLK